MSENTPFDENEGVDLAGVSKDTLVGNSVGYVGVAWEVSASTETLTLTTPANILESHFAAKDYLVSNGYGLDLAVDYSFAGYDVLTSTSPVVILESHFAAKDYLVSDGYGKDWAADYMAGHVQVLFSTEPPNIIEAQISSVDYLIKEPPLNVTNSQADFIVSLPNDPVSIRSIFAATRQLVASKSIVPPQVFSNIDNGVSVQLIAAQWTQPAPISTESLTAIRQLVATSADKSVPHSPQDNAILRQIVAGQRVMLPPHLIFSPIQNRAQRQLVAQSRRNPLPPVSENVVAQSVQLTASAVERTIYEANRDLASLVELVAVGVHAPIPGPPIFVNEHVQIIAQRKQLVPLEPEWNAAAFSQITAQKDNERGFPGSKLDTAISAQLVVVQKIIPANWFEGQFVQLAAIQADDEFPISENQSASFAQLLASQGDSAFPISANHAGQATQLAAIQGNSEFPISTSRLQGLRQLVATLNLPVDPFSTMSLSGARQLVASNDAKPAPHSITRLGIYSQQVAWGIARDIPWSITRMGAQAQQIAQHIDVPAEQKSPIIHPASQLVVAQDAGDIWWPLSTQEYRTNAHLTARKPSASHWPWSTIQLRTMRVQYAIANPVPVHETDRFVASIHRLTASFKQVPPPVANTGRYYASQFQIIAQHKVTTDPSELRPPAIAGSIVSLVASHRFTQPPEDVEDPDTGRHVASLYQLSAQQVSDFPDPGELERARLVSSVTLAVALGDKIEDPPPPPPPSADAAQVLAQVLVYDEWFGRIINTDVADIFASMAIDDDSLKFDPAVPTAVMSIANLQVRIVMGDSFPDPNGGFSDLRATLAAQLPVVADTALPDPTIPISALSVASQFAIPVTAETALPDPKIPQSNMTVAWTFGAAAVTETALPDPTIPVSDLTVAWTFGGAAVKETTLPDPTIPQSRVSVAWTFGGAAVKETTLPDPTIPQSRANVAMLRASVAMIEGDFDDPYKPTSDLDVSMSVAAPALGDATLPDPNIPQSLAEVADVAALPALDDATLPDPNIPQSDVDVDDISAALVFADVTMPDPAIPLSDAHVCLVSAGVAMRDEDLLDFSQMSELSGSVVLATLLIRDVSLLQIPPRAAEARPVVTIRLW